MGFSMSKFRRSHHNNPLVEPQSHNPITSLSLPPPPTPEPPPPQQQQFFDLPPPPPPQTSSALTPPLPPLPSVYPYADNNPYPLPPRPSYYQYPQQPSNQTYVGSQPPPNPYSYPPPYNSQPPHHSQYTGYYNNGWGQGCPPAASTSAVTTPPYVEHKAAKKIKNDVNVHKHTIKLTVDEQSLDSHLVSFTFDALVDGSITLFYFAKEESNCTFHPIYPEIYKPIKIPFQKGLGQKFHQPHGSGMDLGFFNNEELSKPSHNEEIFPLVIYAETTATSLIDKQPNQTQPGSSVSSHAQITQAVLEKESEGQFKVEVVKQILWIDGVRYELREIYGISNVDDKGSEDSDPGKECVICMTEPKDTAVLPCRHMCMCSECAKELRLRSSKCPICRQPIEELLEIKVNNNASS